VWECKTFSQDIEPEEGDGEEEELSSGRTTLQEEAESHWGQSKDEGDHHGRGITVP